LSGKVSVHTSAEADVARASRQQSVVSRMQGERRVIE
jgi:hypothetical protein